MDIVIVKGDFNDWCSKSSSDTLLKRCIDSIIFQNRERTAIHPNVRIQLSQNVRVFFVNCISSLDSFCIAKCIIKYELILVLLFSVITFSSGSPVLILSGLRTFMAQLSNYLRSTRGLPPNTLYQLTDYTLITTRPPVQ